MMRFFHTILAHRNMIRLTLITVSVVAMTLGVTSGALADDGDGFDP